MHLQTDLTVRMRSILISWLAEVAFSYSMNAETLFLAVQILDHTLSSPNLFQLPRVKLQMFGCVSLWLAAKIEVIDIRIELFNFFLLVNFFPLFSNSIVFFCALFDFLCV